MVEVFLSQTDNKKECFAKWHRKLKAKKADSDHISINELWVILTIALTTDEKLQSRFLNFKNPDESALLVKARSYINAKICTRNIAVEESICL